MSYQNLFENLWADYLSITPSAKKVHQVLSQDQADIVNDHVAFRTFNTEKLNLAKLAQHFISLGYKEMGNYEFTEKKLLAKHFEHPDDNAPKVFISELILEQCSEKLQKIVGKLTAEVASDYCENASFLHSGAPWKISYTDYQTLLEESEYAAWMSAWGYHANHFTVSVNKLKNYTHLEEVNEKLKQEGFRLNSVGGEIKGSSEVLLEQSSTMADSMPVNFTDKTLSIPSCFYEFALRYPDSTGKLYNGFVAANANKIFESTNTKA